jgi:hypothetical protein
VFKLLKGHYLSNQNLVFVNITPKLQLQNGAEIEFLCLKMWEKPKTGKHYHYLYVVMAQTTKK